MSTTDINGIILEVNDIFCKVSKYSREELIGQKHNIVNSNYHPPSYFADMWRTIKSGQTWRGEVRNKAKDGSFYWVDTFIAPELDENNKPIKYYSIRILITDKKNLEEQNIEYTKRLDKKNLYLNSLLDAQHSFVVIRLSIDGLFNYANKNFCNLFEIDESSLIGKHFLDFESFNEHDKCKDTLDKCLHNPDQTQYLTLKSSVNNNNIVIDWDFFVIKDSKGEIIEIQGIGRDISRAFKIEQELSYTENKFKNLISNLNELVCEIDENSNFTFVNDQYERVLGYKATELLGTNATNLIHPDDIVNSTFKHKQISEDLDSSIDIWRFRDKNGQYRIFECKGKVYIDSDNKKKTVVISYDLTDKKRLEDMFTNAFQSNAAAMSISRLSTGEYVEVNKNSLDLFGYTREEVIGKTSNELNVFPSSNDRNRLLEKLKKDGLIKDIELQMMTKDKKIIIGLVSMSIVNVAGEQMILNSIVDITERKSNEEKMQKLYEELTQYKDEIEVNLHQKNALIEELEQSKVKLKQSIDSKDKLFSIIAHDLTSPFTSFLNLSEMLVKDMEDLSIKDLKKMSQTINNSANSVFNLLNDLLQWSRSQIGSLEVKFENHNLYELIFACMYIMQEMADKKRIMFDLNIDRKIIITCDKNMFTTIMRNLITNAIKFSNYGGKVKLIAARVDNFIEITVQDFGVGMSEETRASLFGSNRHISTLGTQNEKGNGLGLVLCKEFVSKHKGNIWVESELNKGSKFKFTIADS